MKASISCRYFRSISPFQYSSVNNAMAMNGIVPVLSVPGTHGFRRDMERSKSLKTPQCNSSLYIMFQRLGSPCSTPRLQRNAWTAQREYYQHSIIQGKSMKCPH